jgi:hypothetical protein
MQHMQQQPFLLKMQLKFAFRFSSFIQFKINYLCCRSRISVLITGQTILGHAIVYFLKRLTIRFLTRLGCLLHKLLGNENLFITDAGASIVFIFSMDVNVTN